MIYAILMGCSLSLINQKIIEYYCKENCVRYFKTNLFCWILYSVLVFWKFNTITMITYALFLSATLYVGATIDWHLFILPNEGAILLVLGGLLRFCVYTISSKLFLFNIKMILLQFFVAIIWMMFFIIVRKITNNGLGLGDVKWFGAIAFYIPWYKTFDFILYTFSAGTFYIILAILYMNFKREKITEIKYIPFGPFIALGGVLSIWY